MLTTNAVHADQNRDLSEAETLMQNEHNEPALSNLHVLCFLLLRHHARW